MLEAQNVSVVEYRCIAMCVYVYMYVCMYVQHHKAFQRCISSSENAEAVQHAWVYSLLTQNYSLATSIGRLGLGSVAFKLEQVLQYIASLERILESCNTQVRSPCEINFHNGDTISSVYLYVCMYVC